MSLLTLAEVPLVCDDCGQLIRLTDAQAMQAGGPHDCRAEALLLCEERVAALTRLIAGQRAHIANERRELRRLMSELVQAREHLAARRTTP